MNYNTLYQNNLTQEKYPKVVLKDAWGSTVFLIKGKMPKEILCLKLPEQQFKSTREKSLAEYLKLNEIDIKNYDKGKYIIQVVFDKQDEKIAEVIKISTNWGKEYATDISDMKTHSQTKWIDRYIRKEFHDLAITFYTNVQYYINAHSSTVLITKNNQIVMIVGAFILSSAYSLLTPVEAMRKAFMKKQAEKKP